MASDRENRPPGNRARLAFLLVASLAALAAGAALITWLWVSKSGSASQQIDPLHADWNEFNGGRYDQVLAILDRRAPKVARTAPEWVLRARIAEYKDGWPKPSII